MRTLNSVWWAGDPSLTRYVTVTPVCLSPSIIRTDLICRMRAKYLLKYLSSYEWVCQGPDFQVFPRLQAVISVCCFDHICFHVWLHTFGKATCALRAVQLSFDLRARVVSLKSFRESRPDFSDFVLYRPRGIVKYWHMQLNAGIMTRAASMWCGATGKRTILILAPILSDITSQC